MANKYLEKIADFDFDAHNSMVSTANRTHSSRTTSGWQGNMESFMKPSTAKRPPLPSRASVKGPLGLLKKTLSVFKK